MLRKLLKYDMAAVWKSALAISIASLISAVTGGVALVLTELTNDLETPLGKMLHTVSGIVVVLSFMTMIFACAAIGIIVLERFYKNLFTDEGYLTFTLPVTRGQIIGAKTINSMLWLIYDFLLVTVSGILTALSYGITGTITGLITDSVPKPPEDNLVTFGGWGIGYIIIIAVLVLVCLYYSTTILQFCITLGSVLAKKARILAIIGIYYLINAILSLIGQTIMAGVVIIFGEGIVDLLSTLSTDGMHLAVYGVLIFGILVFGGLGFFFQSMTVKTLDNKLNLP